MNPDVLLAAVLSTITSLVASGAVFFLAWKKAPHEIRSADADAAKTYEEAAELAAARANKLEKELDELRNRVHKIDLLTVELTHRNEQLSQRIIILENEKTDLEARIKYLEKELHDRDNIIDALKAWAEALVHEITRLKGNLTPMPEIATRPRGGSK